MAAEDAAFGTPAIEERASSALKTGLEWRVKQIAKVREAVRTRKILKKRNAGKKTGGTR